MEVVLILIGLVSLVLGAEGLVRGGAGLATRIGVSPLVVGLTVVAFGTGAPELAVSTQAALAGSDAVAVGNAVGSNIFNVLAVLGISACIIPLSVASQLIRIDVPIMIVASFALLALARDGAVDRFDGVLLLAGFVAYTGWTIFQARKEKDSTAEAASSSGSIPAQVALVGAGLVALVFGAGWLVDGATAVAQARGVSDRVIGLTIVAAGTSLPEAATSIVASVRGQRDIAVGNVVGSNLFNILIVIGLPSAISAGGLSVSPATLAFDLPIATAAAVACLPVFLSGLLIERWEGALFTATYLSYVAFLVASTLGEYPAERMAVAAIWFTLPLITIVFGHAAYVRLRRPGHSQEPK